MLAQSYMAVNRGSDALKIINKLDENKVIIIKYYVKYESETYGLFTL